MEVSARKNLAIHEAFENIVKLYINSGHLKRQTLNIMTKFEDKSIYNDNKMKKSSIITSMTKKEGGRDCIIM